MLDMQYIYSQITNKLDLEELTSHQISLQAIPQVTGLMHNPKRKMIALTQPWMNSTQTGATLELLQHSSSPTQSNIQTK